MDKNDKKSLNRSARDIPIKFWTLSERFYDKNSPNMKRGNSRPRKRKLLTDLGETHFSMRQY